MTARSRRVIATAWSLAVVTLLWIPLPTAGGHEVPLDKLAHAVVFGVLGALWYAALGTRHRTGIAVLGGLAFAVLTEVVQGLLPWPRTSEGLDVLADAAGLVLGVLVARRLRRNGRDSNPR